MSVIGCAERSLLAPRFGLDPALAKQWTGSGGFRWVGGTSKGISLYRGLRPRLPEAEALRATGWPKRSPSSASQGYSRYAGARWGDELRTTSSRSAPVNESSSQRSSPRFCSPTGFQRPSGPETGASVHWLVGAAGRFGPHRIVRAAIRDREAARRSLATIMGWDFDRVIVTHGDVLERGGPAALRSGFAHLGPF